MTTKTASPNSPAGQLPDCTMRRCARVVSLRRPTANSGIVDLPWSSQWFKLSRRTLAAQRA